MVSTAEAAQEVLYKIVFKQDLELRRPQVLTVLCMYLLYILKLFPWFVVLEIDVAIYMYIYNFASFPPSPSPALLYFTLHTSTDLNDTLCSTTAESNEFETASAFLHKGCVVKECYLQTEGYGKQQGGTGKGREAGRKERGAYLCEHGTEGMMKAALCTLRFESVLC